jgi:hypothetical protein
MGRAVFDVFISGASAYNQAGFFLGSLFCVGLGGLLLGNALYWRLHSHRATGTIIGVIASKDTYAPVYRYTTSEGETHEARSNISSSGTRGKETGRVVPLLISAHNPSSSRVANNYALEMIGFLLVVPGLVLGYVALTAYPVTWITWIMVTAMLLYLVERGRRTLVLKGQRVSLAEWKQQHGVSATIDLAQVKRIEDIIAASPLLRTPTQSQQARKWAPVFGLFVIILLAVGVWQGLRIAHLEAAGMRALGQVVRVDAKWNSNSHGSSNYTYYPVVRFRTAANETIEFTDSIGSNPPSYGSGDRVTVLYLGDAPRGNAMIDRGRFWNWALPGGLGLGALVVIIILLGLFRREARPA